MKFLAQWRSTDYAFVLVETTNKNLFILGMDINPIFEQICTEYAAEVDQSNFELKMIITKHSKPTNFSNKNRKSST